ncbi:MAG: AgmX/PglI C-terminal domain-containing protein [Leptospira sp.]|nr:AgmX/PglI C-terminal domain-containing protein [Leptospira sp.]
MREKNIGKEGKTKDSYKDVAIKNTLRKKDLQVQACFKNLLLSKPSITQVFIELDWTILEDGTPKDIEIIQSDETDKVFLQCVQSIVSSIKFPHPPLGLSEYVSHKYIFKNVLENKK